MRIASIVIIVCCVCSIAWLGKNFLDVFGARVEYANVLQLTTDRHEHHVAEIQQGKRLHDIHVATSLVSFVVFIGISIVTIFGMRYRPWPANRWAVGGLCFTVSVAATSLLSIGSVNWDTSMLEVLLIGQLLAAALVAVFCLHRLVF